MFFWVLLTHKADYDNTVCKYREVTDLLRVVSVVSHQFNRTFNIVTMRTRCSFVAHCMVAFSCYVIITN